MTRSFFRRIAWVLICLWCIADLSAQNEKDLTVAQPDTAVAQRLWRTPLTDSIWQDSVVAVVPMPPVLYPLDSYTGGYMPWELHAGLNASLSMGVTVRLGKNSFPGAIFGTQMAGMYALPLTRKFTVAFGGYLQNLNWSGWHGVDFGISALAGYHLTDRVSLYAYGSKKMIDSKRPWPIWPVFSDDYDHRLGGMIHVKVNDTFSFSVSLEEQGYRPPVGNGR